jgi:DNA-directed RNA polymerase specialized sigma24 family protein
MSDMMDPPEASNARLGTDVRALYGIALRSTEALASTEDPMQETLVELIQALRGRSTSFQIYCDSRARQHFTRIFTG